ncbi:MAG: hypothetical protein QOJ44_1444 [Acidimicrobiaceae bacterium]|nr:hypothetical protein [Acidimicrobiaceae bacterium]
MFDHPRATDHPPMVPRATRTLIDHASADADRRPEREGREKDAAPQARRPLGVTKFIEVLEAVAFVAPATAVTPTAATSEVAPAELTTQERPANQPEQPAGSASTNC